MSHEITDSDAGGMLGDSADSPAGKVPIVLRPGELEPSAAATTALAAADPYGTTRPAVYLHSLRRRWLSAIGLGLVTAVVAGGLVWYLKPPQYTAVSQLRIAAEDAPLVFDTADRSGQTRFDIYKRTQRQLLKSRFVVAAALRDKEVAQLPIIRDEIDPVVWLETHIDVTFPDDAEIMQVRLSGADPESLRTLVNALVRTYMDEVVLYERNLRLDRLTNLENVYADSESKVRTKRADLRRLAERLGTSDSEALTLVQQNAIQQFALVRNELTRIQFELMRTKGELEIARMGLESPVDANAAKSPANASPPAPERALNEQQAAVPGTAGAGSIGQTVTVQKVPLPAESGPTGTGLSPASVATSATPQPKRVTDVTELELDQAAKNDPIAATHLAEINRLEQLIDRTKAAVPEENAEQHVAGYRQKIAAIRGRYQERRNALRGELTEMNRLAAESGLAAKQMRVAILQEQEKQMKQEVDRLYDEARQFGKSSVDVELMRTEIKALDEVLSRIGSEMERTKVELKSGSRITIVHTASVPKTTVGSARMSLTVFSSLIGFILPICSIVWLDAKRQPVSTAADVSDRIGLNVLGALPFVSPRQFSRPGRLPGQRATWESELSASVDAVAAMLLRRSETHGERVFMVSSAVAGEGKSTLTAWLARSLAQAGRRVLAVDFDLRRPALHGVFDLQIEPGVGEILRNESNIRSAVQHTETDNLSVLTAGSSDQHALFELTQDAVKNMFGKLRRDYDFVIVDAGPILPVVDTRLVARYVDAVILSVLRDVSTLPRIREACAILRSYDVFVLGTVVTGTATDVYRGRLVNVYQGEQ